MPLLCLLSLVDRRACRFSLILAFSIFAFTPSPKVFAAGPAATVTTVTVPSSPFPSGQIVTLKAAVTAAGAPVTYGFVSFREGSVVLGTASLAPDATASLNVQFPPGQFKITAKFLGSNAGQPSVSSPATLTQLGTSSVALSVNTSNQSATLTATVTGNQAVFPTGTVTFFDQTTGQPLGTVDLTAGTEQSGLQPNLIPPVVGTWADMLAYGNVLEGDYNGDGIPDYAAQTYNNSTGEEQLSVFLGQTNGNYTAVPPVNTDITRLFLSADFTNDGKDDLVTSTTNPRYSAVFTSNGDGTFNEQNQVYGTGQAAGDFTGDGKQDLLTMFGNTVSQYVVNPGDGTGNFNPAPEGIVGALEGSVADYNNDGNLDLIFAEYSETTGYPPYPSDFLGNDTGNYNGVTAIPLPTYPIYDYSGGFAADFNGDGKQDLAVYDGSNNLDIFLGDGTGNFITPTSAAGTIIPTGPILTYSVLDVNGDGIPDIVVVLESSINSSNNQPNATPNVEILIGKGNGTFTVYNGDNATPVTHPLLGSYPLTTPFTFTHGIVSTPSSATATATLTIPRMWPPRNQVIAEYHGNNVLPANNSTPVTFTVQ